MKVIILLLLISTTLLAQSNIECNIKGRMGVYLVLEPSNFETAKIFKEGDNASFELFVTKEKANGKEEGYYYVLDLEFINYIEDVKRLRFKIKSDLDPIKTKLNMPDINVMMGEKGRIVVKSANESEPEVD